VVLTELLTLVADGSVGPEGGLLIGRALVLGQNGAGDAQARDHVLLGELEAQALGVVVDILNLGELQRDESLITSGKSLLGLDGSDGSDLVTGGGTGEEVVAGTS
jgi:hypothetical protein